MKNQDNDTFSLPHTTWRCQYHIVFTPKYHRDKIFHIKSLKFNPNFVHHF